MSDRRAGRRRLRGLSRQSAVGRGHGDAARRGRGEAFVDLVAPQSFPSLVGDTETLRRRAGLDPAAIVARARALVAARALRAASGGAEPLRVFLTGGSGFLERRRRDGSSKRVNECAVLLRGEIAATRLAPLAARLQRIFRRSFVPESYRAALTRFAPEAIIHCAWCGVAGADRNDLGQLDNMSRRDVSSTPPSRPARSLRSASARRANMGPSPAASAKSADRADHALWRRQARPLVGRCSPSPRSAALAPSGGASFLSMGRASAALARALAHPRLRGGTLADLTACEQIWEFTHVGDAAAALVALLDLRCARRLQHRVGRAGRLRDAVLLLRDLVRRVEPGFGRSPTGRIRSCISKPTFLASARDRLAADRASPARFRADGRLVAIRGRRRNSLPQAVARGSQGRR